MLFGSESRHEQAAGQDDAPMSCGRGWTSQKSQRNLSFENGVTMVPVPCSMVLPVPRADIHLQRSHGLLQLYSCIQLLISTTAVQCTM